MQRTSKGDCKAPEIVHGEAIRSWRTVRVGSCPTDGLFGVRRVGALPRSRRVGVGTLGIAVRDGNEPS